jgi:hypothetical protein
MAIVIALFFFISEEFDIGGVIGGIIIGGIAAVAFFYYFQSQLKNVKFQHGASAYYREGSMNLQVKEDTFLYKRVTSRRIRDD